MLYQIDQIQPRWNLHALRSRAYKLKVLWEVLPQIKVSLSAILFTQETIGLRALTWKYLDLTEYFEYDLNLLLMYYAAILNKLLILLKIRKSHLNRLINFNLIYSGSAYFET